MYYVTVKSSSGGYLGYGGDPYCYHYEFYFDGTASTISLLCKGSPTGGYYIFFE
jgi:hypothetical protein